MKIGLVGKPNVGKSTFYSAATLAEADIGNYPFTTIDANRGMGAVRVPDPSTAFNVVPTPRTGKVVDGTRFVPVEIVDVAGLVPGAHEGRGLGNKFLSDLAQADVLIHVVDASGMTDEEGVPSKTRRDPLLDVAFLEEEIDAWILGLLKDGWDRVARRVQQENRKMEDAIDERLAGLGIRAHHASVALRNVGLSGLKPADWPADGLEQLAKELRRASKPIVVAWNKVDAVTDEELATLTATGGVVVSAQAELALGRGAAAGTFSYAAGSPIVRTQQLSEAQEKGLQYLESQVLNRFGETGVHKALETAVFEKLGRIPVFPVEDESKLTDKEGRVLPDCHLVKTGTTAKQLAYLVHTDLGDKFVRGIDCRTKRVIGADHVLAAGDIIKIAANA